jgi:hypothetical protein
LLYCRSALRSGCEDTHRCQNDTSTNERDRLSHAKNKFNHKGHKGTQRKIQRGVRGFELLLIFYLRAANVRGLL